MGITYEEYERQNDRGNTLHAVKYTPQSVARAGLVWHHGYGEHCGRYKTVFSALAESGIAVFAQDGFCFGKSERDPAKISYIQQYQFLVDDLLALAEEAAAALPKGTPLFVGGPAAGGRSQRRCEESVSLGEDPSEITLESMGEVFCAACSDGLQSLVGGVLGRLVPRSRLVNAVRPEDMSEDPQVVKAYVEDPLTDVGNVRVHTALQLQQAMKTSTARHHELQMPIYAHHGTNDKCTSLPAVKRLLAAVSSKDKTLNEVPGGYHELLHGEGTLKMAQAMADWILARSEPAPAEQARTDAVPAAAAAAPVSSNL